MHTAREVPVRDLTLVQVRLQLVQRVGLPRVIDEALIRLDDDPLAEGDLNPGDVLAALTGLDGHAGSSWARPSSRRRRAGRPRRSRGRKAPMTRRPGATRGTSLSSPREMVGLTSDIFPRENKG
ncbi:contact-dependent growth inhibition system immunity protein [Tessaracoccus flavescens]|uniref:contact-dependent growth inhibition system immunity protein n=1 Tax=Tessaracoccus flavescens TaxID=399497 RepID=UPI003AABFA47